MVKGVYRLLKDSQFNTWTTTWLLIMLVSWSITTNEDGAMAKAAVHGPDHDLALRQRGDKRADGQDCDAIQEGADHGAKDQHPIGR